MESVPVGTDDKVEVATTGNDNDVPPRKNLLPVIIIPGFMSSGLEVKESNIKPNWIKERIWINLSSLGFEAMYVGNATHIDATTNQDANDKVSQRNLQQRNFKSAWLQHMALQNDMKTETKGVKVRPISGLEGVDYLTPGALTNHLSYVFGPVIDAFVKEGGYTPNVNLQAATYDWRLAPAELENRDQYFTNLIQKIEDMYNRNKETPVVLLCHSLGCKTGHYFLNFCLQHKDQEWIDRYIHTYLPVGGPHLGAPKAIRSVISGDKMSLDAFLSNEEALVMGRSLGSGPWLFPHRLPEDVPSSVYVKPQGVLEVTFLGQVETNTFIEKRTAMSKPKRFQLAVAIGADRSKRIVSTTWRYCGNNDVVSFATEKVCFSTSQNPKEQNDMDGYLQILLQEPGISSAKYERKEESTVSVLCQKILCCLKCLTCFCILENVYRILRCFTCIAVQSVIQSANLISSSLGGSSNLAFTERIELGHEVFSGKKVQHELTMYHRDDYGTPETTGLFSCFGKLATRRTSTVKIQLQWRPYNREKSFRQICSPIANPHNDTETSLDAIDRKTKISYQEFSAYDIIEREGLDSVIDFIKDVYDGDDIGPRTISSIDAPPVRRVHAIYGTNLPTECGAVYSRHDTCCSQDKLMNLYQLEPMATIGTTIKNNGYQIKNGIVYETKQTKQAVAGNRKISGDGTVPYWSLQHPKAWEGQCEHVSIVELEGAEHREILADKRFHQELLKYCITIDDVNNLEQSKV